MRLRNIPGAREEMTASPFVYTEPETCKGAWREQFGNKKPLYIEVGMGKGRFIHEQARLHPDINYLGIEKYSSVMLRAVQKQEEEQLANLRFIRMDAEQIEEVFAPGEVDHIYLNFSDPWPKARHAKRRLTSPTFLGRFARIGKPHVVIEFKTDNMALFDFSEESVKEAGWTVLAITRDLYADPKLLTGNVQTEYEQKFVGRDNAIGKLIVEAPDEVPERDEKEIRETKERAEGHKGWPPN